MHAFNGDPHPGNYLFRSGGRVTFLDFGLVKHFTAEEIWPFVQGPACTPIGAAAVAWSSRRPVRCR